ncbi:hypothetical protein [Mucilaginibacter sp. BT774]|uniref:hypothetical protein n=1 Tax=Mucilaginibacter sp. BT774 TaxID=3062276 RepID=UPI002674BD17|nr:hypothetical protein [Mucilaginibacter sp. BT774]MDO3628163.1 hypothetical protein [Mucilaginibacter sp. BT774]
MKQRNYIRYFRVFKNDTVVTEVSTNDFQPLKFKPFKKDWLIGNTKDVFCAIASVNYSLPIDDALFYGYSTRAKAMEMAKAGALAHINALIVMGKDGELALYEYRFHHYQDLTVSLVEANIHEAEPKTANARLEKEIQ